MKHKYTLGLILILITLVGAMWAFIPGQEPEPEPEPQWYDNPSEYWTDIWSSNMWLGALNPDGVNVGIDNREGLPSTISNQNDNDFIRAGGWTYRIVPGEYMIWTMVGNESYYANITIEHDDRTDFIPTVYLTRDAGLFKTWQSEIKLYETPIYNGTITDKWVVFLGDATGYRFEVDDRAIIGAGEWDWHNTEIGEIWVYKPYDIVHIEEGSDV